VIEYWIKGVMRYGFDASFEEAEITDEPDLTHPDWAEMHRALAERHGWAFEAISRITFDQIRGAPGTEESPGSGRSPTFEEALAKSRRKRARLSNSPR
jgi:hypothetical protein